MRTPVHDDVPLKSLPLARVVVHGDAAQRLYDPTCEPVAAGGKPSALATGGQEASQTPYSDAVVLRAVGTIHLFSGVDGRRFVIPR